MSVLGLNPNALNDFAATQRFKKTGVRLFCRSSSNGIEFALPQVSSSNYVSIKAHSNIQ
jgi:hypothetical protein